jgi:hypothetical protein
MSITDHSYSAPSNLETTSLPKETSPELNGAPMSEAEWRRRQIEKNKGLIELLESWLADPADAEEQRETLDTLMIALDEDRLSDRKLFPWLAES